MIQEKLKSISILIWASNWVDVEELKNIRKLAKSGKHFNSDAYDNNAVASVSAAPRASVIKKPPVDDFDDPQASY